MKESERRVRLIQWLETICKDVEDLLLGDYIFWALQDVVDANPRFKAASGLFTQWIASAFIQATAVGVRRQAKADKDSVSLRRFLQEVKKYPTLVSRKHYMSFYAGKGLWLIKIGQQDFDAVAGAGASYLQTALVDQQFDELKRALEGIEHYVDRRVAHFDKRGLARPTPKLEDLTNSLRILERIVILYWRLLKGEAMTTMLPTILFDWQEIFRFPWSPLSHDVSEAM